MKTDVRDGVNGQHYRRPAKHTGGSTSEPTPRQCSAAPRWSDYNSVNICNTQCVHSILAPTPSQFSQDCYILLLHSVAFAVIVASYYVYRDNTDGNCLSKHYSSKISSSSYTGTFKKGKNIM